MKEYTFEGRSEGEALQAATDELGVLPEDLVYEVIEKRGGVLGFGGQVRIKVRFRGDLIEEGEGGGDEPPPIPLREPTHARDVEPGQGGGAAHDGDEGEDEGEDDQPLPDDEPDVVLTERAHLARDAAVTIVQGMGLSASGRIEEDEESIRVHLRTGDDNLVIGRGGVVLDALQFLVNKIVNRMPEDRKYVVIDVSGYRKRKDDSLERFAEQMCVKTLDTGRSVRLKDLTARERRIVHMVVARHSDLQSQSEGEGDERVLLILPARKG